MNAPNFGSVLDRPSQAIERPRPLPAGHYIMVVKGQPKFDKSTQKKTEYAEYTMVPMQAMEDVDAEALADALTNKATGEKKALQDKTMRNTYYLTDDAIWRLKEFLDHCGVDDGDGITLRQRVNAATGCQVLVTVRNRPSEDGQNMFAEIAGTAAVA